MNKIKSKNSNKIKKTEKKYNQNILTINKSIKIYNNELIKQS